MTDFLADYHDPEKMEDRRQIRQTLRCTELESFQLQRMGALTDAMHALADQLIVDDMIEIFPDEEEEE